MCATRMLPFTPPPDKLHSTVHPFPVPVRTNRDGICHEVRILYQTSDGEIPKKDKLDNPDALAAAAKDGVRKCDNALGGGWAYIRTVNFEHTNEWEHVCRICDPSLADAALMWCACSQFGFDEALLPLAAPGCNLDESANALYIIWPRDTNLHPAGLATHRAAMAGKLDRTPAAFACVVCI